MAIIISLLVFVVVYLLLYGAITMYHMSVTPETMEIRLKAVSTSVQRLIAAEEVPPGTLGRRVLLLLADRGAILFKAPAKIRAAMDTKLGAAGGVAELAVDQFIGIIALGAVSLVVLSLLFALLLKFSFIKTSYTVFAAVLVAVLIPNFVLSQKIARRQASIQRDLPDVLDLITVTVKAGLSFDGALGKLTEKMKGVLVDEFSRMLKEMQMGLSRREALRAMSNRCGNRELSIFVSSLIQADQLGVSIGKVLRVQAASIRDQRRQQIEQKSMKAPLYMLFPLVTCLFPFLFIVILGPAMLTILEKLGNK